MNSNINDRSRPISESQVSDFVSKLECMLAKTPDQFVQFTSDVADMLDLWADIAGGLEADWLEVMAERFRSASEKETMAPLRPPHLTSDMLPRMTAVGGAVQVVIEAYWREIFERFERA
jgi:hypothetical protein